MHIKTMRYHFTPTRTLQSQKQIRTNVGEEAEKVEPSHTAAGKVKWHSRFGKQPGSSSCIACSTCFLILTLVALTASSVFRGVP